MNVKALVDAAEQILEQDPEIGFASLSPRLRSAFLESQCLIIVATFCPPGPRTFEQAHVRLQRIEEVIAAARARSEELLAGG